MPAIYAIRHMFRSWRLFLALLIGITLASTFFAGIDIKANTTAKQALDQKLDLIYVDVTSDISSLSPTQMLSAKNMILNVEGVADVEIVSSAWVDLPSFDQNASFPGYGTRIAGISVNSHVYDGWLNKPSEGMGENETYVSSDASFADRVKPGDVISVIFDVYLRYQSETVPVALNLTMKGLAQLDTKAHAIASGIHSSTWGQTDIRGSNVLLVDWENTMRKVLVAVQSHPSSSTPVSSVALIYADREALIMPWDITASISNIEDVKSRIENALAPSYTLSVNIQEDLRSTLINFQFTSMSIRFAFTIISLPIFFVAWYVGTTVSDVSFNLRRREIGLLLTKGFSRSQILWMFLTQTLILGIVGGVLGVVFGFLLNPMFTQFNVSSVFNLNLISPYTLVLTIAFGVIMAFFSMYSSARKASKLPTIEALREYLFVEEEKAYKKRWPWIAFILGTYKITVFALGINLPAQLSTIVFRSGNFILILLTVLFLLIDGFLSLVGPLLFFWGFTKLFIQVSLKFQELTTRVAKFLGDLGTLATKNVRRNSARSAKIAFLIALIIGYSVQVTGQLASEQDYAIRNAYYNAGADVAVLASNAREAPDVLNQIMGNVSEHVQNGTIEYSFSAFRSGFYTVQVRAVEPRSWLKAAYYEDGWFSGRDAATAFNMLANDNDTIILEQGVSKPLKLGIGDSITLAFGGVTKTLKVAGFFGPEPSGQQQQVMIMPQYAAYYWSFVPERLYKEISDRVSATAKILLKLKSGADGKSIAEQIRNLGDPRVSYVQSFAENWESSQKDVVAVSSIDVQRLGIVFAFLAASVGTALVSIISMKERDREATIMSVRGLSYKQLITMFLTENVALVTFATILGLLVGFVVTNGNIASTNSYATSLVQHRLVFPLDSALLLFSCISFIFLMTIVPILVMSKKYVTKLERMVRLR